jgi:hypothetical protein
MMRGFDEFCFYMVCLGGVAFWLYVAALLLGKIINA